MTVRIAALLAVIAGFGILTGLALREVGYWGIIAPHFRSWGAAQVFVDLVILAVLACLWMGKDASQRRSLPAGPFIALTILAGSFGPLLYLLLRELRRPPAR